MNRRGTNSFVLSRLARWWIGLALFAAMIGRLFAHQAYLTSALAKIGHDGHFQITVRFDALAFALNDSAERIPDKPMNDLLDGPTAELARRMSAAREHFARHIHVVADGHDVAIEQLQFPTADDVLLWKTKSREPRLPVLLSAEVSGQLPVGVRQIAVGFPEIIGTIVLTIERPGEEALTEALEAGVQSPEFSVAIQHSSIIAPAAEPGILVTVGQFVVLGFEHILPRGLDHVLFVLGLFLLVGRISVLFLQVTAFTLAHSVTLALALYGVVRVPAALVEPLIALSILFVAVDNLRPRHLPRWRIAVVFGFGLVHGLGFAGALVDLGLPRTQFLRALVGFNFGVELGQLTIIALAFLVVGWWRSHRSYRRFVVVPASTCIALVAAFWFVERCWQG